MGTLGGDGAIGCDCRAVLTTAAIGVGIGVTSSVATIIGSHVLFAVAHPAVAAPALAAELLFGTFVALLFSLAAVTGASAALAIFDHRLRRSRVLQAGLASLGAVGSVLALLAYFGPAVTLGAGFLAFIAIAAFALMWLRSTAHRRIGPAPAS